MVITSKLRSVVLAAVACLAGCQRCSSAPGQVDSRPRAAGSSSAAPSVGVEAPAAASASGVARASEADVPEIVDTGRGRATAALRAVLKAYGIAFEAATIERECKVDDDGASLDDIEDVAVKYGIDAGTVIVPAEHVLLSQPKMLPAIVVVDAPDDEQEFVVAWRLDGDRVQIMDPREGRRWILRAELQKRLHIHAMSMPLDEYRAAIGAPDFSDALQARMTALGEGRVGSSAPRALLDRAAADPGVRGLGALDAAIRAIEADPPDAGVDAKLSALFLCASEKRCEGVSPIPPSLWSVQPAPPGPDGEAQVQVRGAVLLAIEGPKSAP
jgi:hypothetical protein